MKIKLVNVKVHKEAGIIAVDKNVPMYEASILRLMYGEELVDFANTNTGLTTEAESAQDEYRRLSDLYGTDKDRGAKRVELIFGFFETGKFEEAFNDSIAEDVDDDSTDNQDSDDDDSDKDTFYTKKDGTPFKRQADLEKAMAKDGVEDKYEVVEYEDGFVGQLL